MYCAASYVVFMIGSIWVSGFSFCFDLHFALTSVSWDAIFFFLISKEMQFGFLLIILNYYMVIFGQLNFELKLTCPSYHKTATSNVFLLLIAELRNEKEKEINYAFLLILGLGYVMNLKAYDNSWKFLSTIDDCGI